MRKISLITFMLCAFQIIAQNNNSSQQDFTGPTIPFTQQISQLFEHVDLSEVQLGSGILFEHGYPYFNLDVFDGTINNENETSVVGFGLTYASLYSMALSNSQRLPDPSTYRNIMDVIGEESSVIPLAVLHQSYFKIDTLSLIDNLLVNLNDQFYDVPNRSRSPYLSKECFIVVPAATSIKGNSVTFKYDANLMFNNTGKQLAGLFVDMDNGQGYQQTTISANLSAQYLTLGEKNIKFKLSYTDGSSYESHTKILLFEEFFDDYFNTDYFVPSETTHITAVEGYLGDDGITHYGSGTVHVSYGCGHTSLQKPFIWAEGFNPVVGDGDQAIDLSLSHIEAVRRLDDIQIGDKALTDYLYDEGYDLITLDYDDGGDYLPSTANFIKEVLRWANQKKANAGSIEKNVIIGQSMGGMSARYALRDMELDGEDHEVATYISFDSGHQGVSIPIGVQHLVRHIVSAPVLDIIPLASFVTRLENLEGLLDLPATRTMLKYQPDDVTSLNADYYDMQNVTLGMPANCEVLAIANGAGSGVPSRQNFAAGELIFHSKETSISIITGFARWRKPKRTAVATAVGTFLGWELGTFAFSNLRVWAMPSAPSPYTPVYKGIIGVSFLGITIINSDITRFAYNLKGIDHAQGGLIFPHNLSSPELDIPTDLIPTVYELGGFCFTPTVSTLNFDNGGLGAFANPEYNITNTAFEIENNNVRDVDNYVLNSIVDDYGTFIEFKSSKHTWFTPESHAFMLYHLTGTDMLSGETVLNNNDVFQFGKGEVTFETHYIGSAPIRTQSIQPYSLTFKDNSRLYVNASGSHRIGLTPNTDYSEPNLPPFTKDVSHFRLDIRNKCDETGSIIIKVEDNAQFVIGDHTTRTGEVVVHSGHKIVVKNGGKLIIHQDSRLTLLSNSQLVIEPGGVLIIEDGGKLSTKWGGDIVFHENAEVHLRGHNAEMDLTGQLFLMTNADFRPLHDGVSSGRILVRCPVGLLAGMSGSRFRLMGDGNSDHMLTIIEDGALVANMEMEQLLFSSCKVVYRSERWDAITSYTNFTSANVDYVTQSNLEDIDHHGALNLFAKSLVVSSDFTNIDLYAHPEVDYDGYFLNIMGSTFQHTYDQKDQLLHVKGGNLLMNNSSFTNFSRTALFTEQLDSYSQINQTTFEGIGALSTGVKDKSYSELRLSKNTFLNTATGVRKKYGDLLLRCNAFTNISFMAVFIEGGCNLEMSTNNRGGYNVFTNITGTNIYAEVGGNIHINNGYNYFDNGSPYPIIFGKVSIGGGLPVAVLGARNRWDIGYGVPPSTEFYVYNEATASNLVFVCSSPADAACGSMDLPGGPIDIYDDPSGGASMMVIQTTSMTSPLPLNVAISNATNSIYANTGQSVDFSGIILLSEIVNYSYPQQDALSRAYLDYATDRLHLGIEYLWSLGELNTSNNTQIFELPIQNYVNSLNNRSALSTSDYQQKFHSEMLKSHILRTTGHNASAISVLQNTEKCALGAREQTILNDWKYVYEEELAQANYGIGYQELTQPLVDSSNYLSPVTGQVGTTGFNSVVSTPVNLQFQNCLNKNMVNNPTSLRRLVLYPNPTKNNINIELIGADNLKSTYRIIGPSGKIILQGETFSSRFKVDVSSLQSGLYFVVIDGNEEVPIVKQFVRH